MDSHLKMGLVQGLVLLVSQKFTKNLHEYFEELVIWKPTQYRFPKFFEIFSHDLGNLRLILSEEIQHQVFQIFLMVLKGDDLLDLET